MLSTINHRIQPLFVGNWTLSNRGPILYPSPLALWGKWSASLRPWRRGWRGERHSEQQPLEPPPGALERSNSPPRSNGKISNYQCHETQIARKTIGICVCVIYIYIYIERDDSLWHSILADLWYPNFIKKPQDPGKIPTRKAVAFPTPITPQRCNRSFFAPEHWSMFWCVLMFANIHHSGTTKSSISSASSAQSSHHLPFPKPPPDVIDVHV